MPQLELRDIVKIYPYVDVKKHLFDRKRAKKRLEEQRRMPYLTNEGVVAVQQFSLSVEAGEFVVLYGPSGCGKSTVLRMIAGLTDVTAGTLLINGEDQEGVPSELRDIAMVFQEYSLYPHFTVEENIAFPLKNLHIPREELDRKVDLMVRLLELQKVRKEKPATLSGGEMQRTAIGRALIKRPEILLLDEPFSNLDAPLRMKLRVLMKRIHQEVGTTFIYVTHDMQEALSLATKLVVMKDGMIVQQGSPSGIYQNPENTDAAIMVGTPQMNLFPEACLVGDEKGSILRLYGKEFLFRGETDHPKFGPVIFGIRPVHVLLYREPGQGERIQCSTVDREAVGSEIHYLLMPSSEREEGRLIRAVVKADEPAAAILPGQDAWIGFMTERAFLFDPESEERI